MGTEVIALWISYLREKGQPVPQPTYFLLEPHVYSAAEVQTIRSRLGVSQERFARMLNVSVSTVRAWEQDLRQPDGPSLRLLEVADQHPELFLQSA
ncbi:MAG: helix-turn-helix domain-containing protein [Thermomicrobiales bacterium]